MLNHKIRYTPIISYLKSFDNFTLLECGSGSQGIGKYSPNLKFTGLDVHFNDYGGVKDGMHNKNMTRVVGSVCSIPLKDSEFDFVLSLDMIEHLNDNDRNMAISEMIRVSRKACIIGFPCDTRARNLDMKTRKIYHFLGIKEPLWLTEHLEGNYPNSSNIEGKILKKYKFTIEKNTTIGVQLFIILFEIFTQGIDKMDRLFPFSFCRAIMKSKSNSYYRKIYFISK